jgi:hypothetical protein
MVGIDGAPLGDAHVPRCAPLDAEPKRQAAGWNTTFTTPSRFSWNIS